MVARTVSVKVVGDADSAKKALEETGGAAEKNTGRIGGAFHSMLGTLNSTGLLGPFGEAIERVTGSMEGLLEKGKSVGAGMLKVGAAGRGAGMMLQSIGSKDKEALNQLKAAVDQTGGSYEEFAGRVEKSIKVNEKFGHGAADTQDAIRKLTMATNDTGKALDEMGIVSNLAGAKHISLSEAASMVAKMHGGATRVLKEFGIAAEKAGGNSKQMAAEQKLVEQADMAEAKAKENLVMMHERLAGKTKLTVSEQQGLVKANEAVVAATAKSTEAHKKLADMHLTVTTSAQAADDNISKLGDKLKGQASAQADSFSGHMRALKAEVEDAAAKFGQKYGPAITAAGAGMTALGGITEAGAGIIGKFSSAQKAATVVQEGMTVAETEGAVAEGLALGPILLIIAAIALLALGAYELVTHWKAVWGWVKQAVSDAFDWIGSHWPLILAILTGPFGLLVLFVKDHFNEIVSFIRGVPAMIGHVGEEVGKALYNGWAWGINNLIGMWNWFVGLLKLPAIDLPFGLGHFGGIDIGGGLQLPKVPYLDTGGIAYGPMLAALSMNNTPEAITTPKQLADFAGYAAGGGGDAGKGDVYMDGKKVGEVVWSHLRAQGVGGTRRNAVQVGLA